MERSRVVKMERSRVAKMERSRVGKMERSRVAKNGEEECVFSSRGLTSWSHKGRNSLNSKILRIANDCGRGEKSGGAGPRRREEKSGGGGGEEWRCRPSPSPSSA